MKLDYILSNHLIETTLIQRAQPEEPYIHASRGTRRRRFAAGKYEIIRYDRIPLGAWAVAALCKFYPDDSFIALPLIGGDEMRILLFPFEEGIGNRVIPIWTTRDQLMMDIPSHLAKRIYKGLINGTIDPWNFPIYEVNLDLA